MAPFKPSSLKVVELRQELSSRGLPTKGKKDELVARLTEALAAENNKETPEEQSVADSQPSTEAPKVTETATAQENETAQNTEKPAEPVEKPVETVEKPAETISTNETPLKESAESAKDQTVNETVHDEQPKKSADTDKDQTMEETNESSVNDKKEISKVESKSKGEPMESTDKSVTNQNDPSQNDKVSTKTTEASTNQADISDETNLKRKAEQLEEENHEKKAKLDENNGGIKNSAIYVKGFVRPLIIRQVQDLFGKYGNVKRFWMDNIKTHCYVMYETDAEASEAFNKVNGIIFPPDTGKALSVGELTSEQVEQLISFEQSAAERRLRVDWEANIDKVKAGEELASIQDSRKTRNIGIGQIAKQLAQAATPAVTASRTPTPTNEKPQEQNDSNLTLEDLFRKTTALPHLYYLPVSEEIAKERLAKLLK